LSEGKALERSNKEPLFLTP